MDYDLVGVFQDVVFKEIYLMMISNVNVIWRFCDSSGFSDFADRFL